MATYFLSPIGNSAQITATGAPLNAGTITTFQAGTATPVATYTDNAGSNPSVSLTLNTLGLPSSPVWLLGGQAVKFVIKDSLGNLVRTIDNVQGIDDPVAFGITFPADGTFAFRNRLINGNAVINQRAVSGTVTLAAGAYGHDRWKAGAGGCTYTFAAVGNSTVITISAGSLMQVVEDKNVEGGVYTLVNRGTALARYAINGGTTSGVYVAASAAAPLQTSSATANQTMTVEFTTGTVDRVQLEPGATATTFERRPYGAELALCQRYYEIAYATVAGISAAVSGQYSAPIAFKVNKRVAPTFGAAANIVSTNVSAATVDQIADYGARYVVTASAAAAFSGASTYPASAEL